jgi:aminocarboxymuconate-semialdehyde decarboxylase
MPEVRTSPAPDKASNACTDESSLAASGRESRAGLVSIGMIDIHSHVVPTDLVFKASADRRWPEIHVEDRRARVEIDGKLFRVVRSVCWDMPERIDEMAGADITVQAISPMPELFSYWSPAAEGADYCRAMNEWIADKVQAHPDSLVGLGIVPLQDLDLACASLAAVRSAGLAGVEIGSNVAGRNAGSAHFLPFFAEAARLGLCVFVHSFHPLVADQLPEWAVNGVAFPIEAGLAAEALVVNGILDAVPGARIAISHGAGGAPFTIPRLDHLWNTDEKMRAQIAAPPIEELRRLYCDSLVFSDAALSFLIEAIGRDQVCVGTDFPFFPVAAGLDPVLGLELDEKVRTGLIDGNARRYLGISAIA